jgi:glycosyltransferase involved in cell wall biosynthesis
VVKILAYVHLRRLYRATGGGRVARNIIESLSSQKLDTIRILGDANDYRCVVPKIGAPWSGYEYHLFYKNTARQQRNWLLFDSPVAETFWNDADIVYCTGESYVPTKKARSIVLMHDAAYFDESAHRRSPSFYLQQTKWRYLFAKLARCANLFHTVSQFSSERIAHHFPALKNRLRVVPNGVTDYFFSCENNNDRNILKKWGVADRPYILLPGGLSYRKNGDTVIDAWPLVRELYNDLALVVTSQNEVTYVRRAKSFGKEIIVTGFIEDEELRALYRGARVVWFPSLYEGFGIPVLEAMACGTPVVASNSSSLPEVAGDAAIFVPALETGKHVEAIEYLVKDANIRANYSTRGRERASAFTWPNSAVKLRAVFSELA